MTSIKRGSDILAFTVTHGARRYLQDLVPAMRATAGMWFDWMVVLSGADAQQKDMARAHLNDPNRTGIQFLLDWPENRGQHYAMIEALNLARLHNYRWLLRIDDDIKPKTKRWLSKMIDRNRELNEKAPPEMRDKFILCPRVVGLKFPVPKIGIIDHYPGEPKRPLPFPVEIVRMMGGACRLHPVNLLRGYIPPLDAPRGRHDPQELARYLGTLEDSPGEPRGFFLRFPDIRVIHQTSSLEADETDDQRHARRMNHYWPYIPIHKPLQPVERRKVEESE